MYDPTVGRWLSEDPIWPEGGINPNVYVENCPTIYTDSTGLAIDDGLAHLGEYIVYADRTVAQWLDNDTYGNHLATVYFDPKGSAQHLLAARAIAEAINKEGRYYGDVRIRKDQTVKEKDTQNVIVRLAIKNWLETHRDALYGQPPVAGAQMGRPGAARIRADDLTATVERPAGTAWFDAYIAAAHGYSTADDGTGRSPEDKSQFVPNNWKIPPDRKTFEELNKKNHAPIQVPETRNPRWKGKDGKMHGVPSSVADNAGAQAAVFVQGGARALNELAIASQVSNAVNIWLCICV